MEVSEIQQFLKISATDDLLEAIKSYLKRAYPKLKTASWNKDRLLVAAEQAIYSTNKINAGTVDGLVGPQTRHAREVWEAKQSGDPEKVKEVETWKDKDFQEAKKNAWPTQSGVSKYYGKVGENQTMLVLPFPMVLAWDTDKVIRRISVHEKVHDSAKRCFARIADAYPDADVRRKLGLDLFGGSLNVRKMRGGSAWSMHSWGIAIDFDPDRNQLKWGRDRARLAKSDCARFWDIWEEEGWLSLGRSRNYDWMQIQAARI